MNRHEEIWLLPRQKDSSLLSQLRIEVLVKTPPGNGFFNVKGAQMRELLLNLFLQSSSVLEFESVYLEELPNATQYERSYMHRDVISHVVVTK